MKKISFLSFLLFILFQVKIRADEGMWIPLLIEKYNIDIMQAKGLRLSAKDIYSNDSSSLKDAIMIFGGGCTGELISDKGLILTNHHCGYGSLQKHSSVENNILKNGFWARKHSEELTNKGLTVKLLVKIIDITEEIEKHLISNQDKNKETLKSEKIKLIKEEATKDNHYKAVVEPFYYGNEYYLFLYEEFRDIRLVGAPPSSIGKFGGDTDNWMWPRHTGDFSIFRIYANENNKPADYSKENKPYKPKKHLKISTKGYKKGDFTFIFGFPGHTQEYLTSYAVDMIQNKINPHRIKLRDKRLKIMHKYMNTNEKIKIQYSAKHASVSNAWKKWIGQNRGLKKMNAIKQKEEEEKKLQKWITENKNQETKKILAKYKDVYSQIAEYEHVSNYFFEAIYPIEIFKLGLRFRNLTANNNKIITDTKNYINTYFKDYNANIDKEIFVSMIIEYNNFVDEKYKPKFLKDLKNEKEIEEYANKIFTKSIFNTKEKLINLLDDIDDKKLKKNKKDLLMEFIIDFIAIYSVEINAPMEKLKTQLSTLNTEYMKLLLEYNNDKKKLYPDANFTARISYGNVDSYFPEDAVEYTHFTTLKGIVEKNESGNDDYKIPSKLLDLYKTKSFGNYVDKDGSLHVCFIASNHTTGGNSGSPVLNADGHLIGVNFDRNWEGTMSDIAYDPSQCRNITLDIRYVLFIIDKFANAKNIIDELDIVK